jgi:hypothetical protein
MQLLQAGKHRLLLLEYDPEHLAQICQQAGFAVSIEETSRSLTLDLTATERRVPLLVFDAAEPANLGWFSRCQFYIDGATGNVLQTPITVANKLGPRGQLELEGVRLRLAKELPPGFKLPGRQVVSEQVIYGLLFSLLSAMLQAGVAVCGRGVFRPLHGRREPVVNRN